MDLVKFEYFGLLMILLAVTLCLEKLFHIHLYKSNKERLEIVAIFFIIRVVWDTFAIWSGHWMFPSGKHIGLVVGFMPVEEYLFILIIPYMVITIYKVIDVKFRRK